MPVTDGHFSPCLHRLVVFLAVVVLLLQEEVLVSAIPRESDRGRAETGEAVLEAVEAGEGALVSPCLTTCSLVAIVSTRRDAEGLGGTDARSQGSYRGVPVDSLKCLMLKPVMFFLGTPWAARSILVVSIVSCLCRLEGRH